MAPTLIALVDTPLRLAPGIGTMAAARGVPVAVSTPHDAVASIDLTAVDAVLVALHTDDDDPSFDRCIGVGAIRDLAARRGPAPRPLLVAIADRPVSDVVRLRLQRAGADRLERVDDGWLELARAVASGPSAEWHPSAASLELASHGIRLGARVDEGLDCIQACGLQDAFLDRTAGAGGGLSRRRAITVRTKLAERVGIRSVTTSSGAVLERNLPSWRQVVRLLDAARGVDPDAGPDADPVER